MMRVAAPKMGAAAVSGDVRGNEKCENKAIKSRKYGPFFLMLMQNRSILIGSQIGRQAQKKDHRARRPLPRKDGRPEHSEVQKQTHFIEANKGFFVTDVTSEKAA